MKGELKIRVTGDDMDSIMRQLKNSSRFCIFITGTAVSVKKITMSHDPILNIELHDPQIIYRGRPIDNLSEIRIDKLREAKCHVIEIRLTNIGRRSLISFMQNFWAQFESTSKPSTK